jgi:hypothetical protein
MADGGTVLYLDLPDGRLYYFIAGGERHAVSADLVRKYLQSSVEVTVRGASTPDDLLAYPEGNPIGDSPQGQLEAVLAVGSVPNGVDEQVET